MATTVVHRPAPDADQAQPVRQQPATASRSGAATMLISAVDELVRPTARGLVEAGPVVLARTVAVAVTAHVGHKILDVLGPRPEYKAIIQHRPDPTPNTRCIPAPEHAWQPVPRPQAGEHRARTWTEQLGFARRAGRQ
jgi:hypothetical protein